MQTTNQFCFGCQRRHITRSEMASRGCNHFPDAFCYICGQFIKTRAKKFSVTASAKMVKNSYFGIKKNNSKSHKNNDRNNGHFLLFSNEKSWKIAPVCQRQKSCYIVNTRFDNAVVFSQYRVLFIWFTVMVPEKIKKKTVMINFLLLSFRFPI